MSEGGLRGVESAFTSEVVVLIGLESFPAPDRVRDALSEAEASSGILFL